MDGVIRVLAMDVGRQNITVNEVAPGWTLSEEEAIQEKKKRLAALKTGGDSHA
jgi:NAD(P)-dependent dehydrogenase (short-subunit alcohol dehydrogenase family)